MIFISYARDDRRLALALEHRLCAAGYPVSKDEPMPESDAFWRRQVLDALNKARVLLVVWSPHARMSPWVDQEVRAFSGRRVWYLTRDVAGRSANAGDVIVRDWPSLEQVLASLVPKGHPRALSHGTAEHETWRRRDAVARARRQLRQFRRATPPGRKLRAAADGGLVMEECDMTFRRVAGDVYLLDRPVTCAQYRQFLDVARFPLHAAIDIGCDRESLPVTSVSWFEAIACAEWFGGTLPTEGEWEHAAAARRNLRYATASGTIGPHEACFGQTFGSEGPRAAASYPPNPAGFYGMCGNTWDWCASSWSGHRVIRGGSWMDRPEFCTVDARYRNAPLDRDCTVGFRIRLRVNKDRSGHYEAIRPGIPR